MFKAATLMYAKEVGSHHLFAPSSLDEAENCVPLQVVIKRKRYYFWQKAKYIVTPYTIEKLLKEETNVDRSKLNITSKKFGSYSTSGLVSLKGKIGGEIKTLLNMELSARDNINLTANLGDVTKEEVDVTALYPEMKEWALDLENDYIKEISSHPRNILCVVTASLKLDKEATLSLSTDLDIDDENQTNQAVGCCGAANLGGELEEKFSKTMTIPAETPVAYEVYEVMVSSDGSMRLVRNRDEDEGCFDTQPEIDYSFDDDGIEQEIVRVWDIFLHIPCHDKVNLNRHLQRLLANPGDAHQLIIPLKNAMRNMNGLRRKGSDEIPTFQNSESAIYLLEKAGFQIGPTLLSYPKECTPQLKAIILVVQAILELDDESAIIMSKYDFDEGKMTVDALSAVIKEGQLTPHIQKSLHTLSYENYPEIYALFLRLELVEKSNYSIFKTPLATYQVHGAYRVAYAIWGQEKEEEPETERRRKWCTLL